MRQWMCSPKWMCNQHLLGEHRELHAIIGILHKGTSIAGYIDSNCIEVSSILERHNAIADELFIRGYKHKTPIIESEIVIEHLPIKHQEYKIDRKKSAAELFSRCKECAKRCEIYSTVDLDFTDAFYCDNSIIFQNQYGVCGLMQTEIRMGVCYTCNNWDYESYQFGSSENEPNGKNKGFCTANNRNKPTEWCHSCDIGMYDHKPMEREDKK